VSNPHACSLLTCPPGNAYQRLGNAPEQQRLLERAQSIAETLPGHQVGCQQRLGMGFCTTEKKKILYIYGVNFILVISVFLINDNVIGENRWKPQQEMRKMNEQS